jgi:lipid-binding SYLF domain-containing protein
MKTMRMIWWCLLLTAVVCASSASAGLFGPKGKDVEDKKANVRAQRDEMLAEVYSSKPELKKTIADAVGYATFKNLNINLLLLATANGYGMVVDNKTGKETFMRMASLGGGIGAGVKDIRVVFIFHDPNVMNQFVEKGWQFGGTADAAAKYEDTGVAGEAGTKANVSAKEGINAGVAGEATGGLTDSTKASGRASTQGGMEIYQFTESGLALQATVSGTKYWKDGKLNEQPKE